MEQINFACNLTNNSDCNDLAVEFWLDNNKFFDSKVLTGVTPVNFSFDEDETEHWLKIVLKNKTINHTKVSDSGEILSDVLISVTDISFDDIQIDQIFSECAIYKHDFNGTGNFVKDKFYGNLGCNGEVTVHFFTPFYLWLLENM